MNENEMERLFGGYRASLGTCGRLPVRRAARRGRWVLAGGALIALTFGVALWPSYATAQAFRRVNTALAGIRSMDVVDETMTSKGWKVAVRWAYEDGCWRVTRFEGHPLEVTYIVSKGGVITDQKQLDHVVQEPLDPEFHADIVGARDPLDFAKKRSFVGEVGTEAHRSLESHPDVDGRPTYALLYTRRSDRYRCEIVVDRATDLPISSELTVDYGEGKLDRSRTRFRFGEPHAATTFEAPTGRRLVDLVQAKSELTHRWSKPIAAVGATKVWDACVAQDGTIWIATSGPVGPLPSKIDGYVRVNDFVPSAVLLKERRFKLRGKEVRVVGFAPLTQLETWPRTETVGFARRRVEEAMTSRWPKSPAEVSVGSLDIKLRPVPGDRPDYATALDLDHVGLQLAKMVTSVQAQELENEGRFLEAAEACERWARACQTFIPRLAKEPLEKAAALYERLGRTGDAERVRKEASVWAAK